MPYTLKAFEEIRPWGRINSEAALCRTQIGRFTSNGFIFASQETIRNLGFQTFKPEGKLGSAERIEKKLNPISIAFFQGYFLIGITVMNCRNTFIWVRIERE